MGEYYITGFFNDLSLNFYNLNIVDLSLNKLGSDDDIYIAKYNPNGNVLWARQIGGIGLDNPVSIITDNTNVYLTGMFNGPQLIFYNSNGGIDVSLNNTLLGSFDTYMAKYNSDGMLLWARQIGGINQDRSISLVTDNSIIYLTGFFTSPQLNFYNSTGGRDTSLNATDLSRNTFIAKYNSDGMLSWARQIGGIGEDSPINIVTDNTNVYVTGYFYSKPLNFYNSIGDIDTSLNTTDSSGNTFIAKYNPNGNVLWARQIGGIGLDNPVSIITDNTNVYLTGMFNGPQLIFYNSNGGIDVSLNNTLLGSFDTYMAKYNSDGMLLWARQIGGINQDRSISLVTDNSIIYLTGFFTSPQLNFYNSTGGRDTSLNATDLSRNTFIAKYNSDGMLSWARQIGGTANYYPLSIITDNTNIYITGYFDGSLNFYNSNGDIDISFNYNGIFADTYIAKYLSNGTLSWARQIAGTRNDLPVSIITDNTNVYLLGNFSSTTLNFYNSDGVIDLSLNNVSSVFAFDIYLVKYNPNGNVLWARQIGGTATDRPVSLVTDNSNIYLTGMFNGSLNFYNSNGGIDVSFNNVSSGTANDTFISKYNLYGTISWARQIGGINNTQPVSACVTIIQSPISNICFLAGTSVMTDQGVIEIQNITNENTINNIRVKYITETVGNSDYLICIEKDAIFENIPNQNTIITRNHKLLYNGNLVEAETIPNTKIMKYNGEILYNVLLEENSFMNVNNLICETLDVNNVISKLYDHPNKNGITKTLNSIINTGNKELYKKTAFKLLS